MTRHGYLLGQIVVALSAYVLIVVSIAFSNMLGGMLAAFAFGWSTASLFVNTAVFKGEA